MRKADVKCEGEAAHSLAKTFRKSEYMGRVGERLVFGPNVRMRMQDSLICRCDRIRQIQAEDLYSCAIHGLTIHRVHPTRVRYEYDFDRP